MENPVTFGVTFIPKSSKASEGKAPLYARITLNGERIELSLQRRITLHLWDERKRRLKGSSAESIQVNKSLDRIFNKIYESFRQLQNENKLLGVKAIKARYLGTDDTSKKLSTLLDYHTENMKDVLKYGTMKNYYTTERYLYKFLKKEFKVEDIYLKQINYQFILDFEHFLRSYKPKRSRPVPTNNGIMKHLERLKKLLNLAQKLEWIEKDPFAKFNLKFKKSERAYLNDNELHTIEDHHFDRVTLEQTRDVFVFSCYTGLSWIDVKNLNRDHIVTGFDGRKWIFTAREKNDIPVKIPILPTAHKILSKYSEKMRYANSLLQCTRTRKLMTI